MQLRLNALDINSCHYLTEEIQFDSAPPIEFSDLSFASGDGAKFINSRYSPRSITIRGRITQTTVALLETEMDTFKKTLLENPNINLNFSYASGFRQYVGNVENLTLARKHFNLTYVPFEITFIAGDPPFAQSIATIDSITPDLSEVFSSDNITGNTYTHTLTFDGTAPPLAKWTYLVDALSGVTAQTVFKSIKTGNQMEINAALTAGDEITIDEENFKVTLNGYDFNYEGVFPKFKLGANELQVNVYGDPIQVSSGLFLDQSQLISNIYGNDISKIENCQTFTPSLTKLNKKISVALFRAQGFAGANVQLRLWSMSGGLPSVILETATTYVDATPSTEGTTWVDFTFSQTLTAGVLYAFSIVPNVAYGTKLMPMYNVNNPYSGGGLLFRYAGVWYTTVYDTFDMAFKTYWEGAGSIPFNYISSLKIEQKPRYL